MASPALVTPGTTDLLTQKAILEQLFLKSPVEGEFWYVIVAEWLEQLKRYIGIPTTRKFYHQRSHPGPLITRRDYAHTVDVVHEDAWRMMVQWYGLADGHKPIKLVVYSYTRAPDIEHNLNSFKLMLSDSPPEDFHNVKFSKMEKVGHIEWKLRELYRVTQETKTRLWAKPDSDGDWRILLYRDKTIGKELGIDSDFIRPIIALEISNENGEWQKKPEGSMAVSSNPAGPFYERSIFDDLTSTWEMDIHDQIDHIGKSLMDNLHFNFSAFVQKAKDYVDERDYHIRQRERDINIRETYINDLILKLEEKDSTLDAQIESCQRQMTESENRQRDMEADYSKKKEELDRTYDNKHQDLKRERDAFEMERDHFHAELKRMSEMYKIQDGRIKLDIGGHQFTTSLTTLTRDPESMLAAMFSGRHQLKVEQDGSYFIDRDGVHFRYILNYLRDGGIKDGTIPHNENVWRELLTEAEYYQINGLTEYLASLLYKRERDDSDTFV